MLDVGGTKNLLFESLFHGAAKNLSSMALQDDVQPIDVVEPLPGPAMNDLREVEESGLSEFEQLLTLQITLAALSGYRRHQVRAMHFYKLLHEILLIVEAPHFEEGRFYEAHQVLDGPFLLRLLRPTQLHPDAQLEHDVSKDRIPFRDLAVPLPLQGHRLRSIKH